MGADASKVHLPQKIWKRPENLGPRIWYEEGDIVVRDVTPDLKPFVLEHMKKYYLNDEPMNKALHTTDDESTTTEQILMWENCIYPDNVSIAALKKGTPGADMDKVSVENPPVIVGVNQLFVSSKNDPPFPDFKEAVKSEKLLRCLNTFRQTSRMVNVFERYGVDHYIDGGGMSVSPEWRGKGIGQMLVQARYNLCKEMGIPLTKTIFTAVQSQKVALKGGFELLGEILYKDLKEPDGQIRFPDMPPEHTRIMLMAKRIE
ncbi:uncharacterized protein LOC132192722 [Neocloeon triangulifer]|uniref:uncharacterized protein LOC132192722 n=1 Tax=Neocloeon triangulifer TaxID=2078957 RepID=UPI00286EF124|nr:uncharacterized protein LOC132192722 [Neocloeon triangulifer]